MEVGGGENIRPGGGAWTEGKACNRGHSTPIFRNGEGEKRGGFRSGVVGRVEMGGQVREEVGLDKKSTVSLLFLIFFRLTDEAHSNGWYPSGGGQAGRKGVGSK